MENLEKIVDHFIDAKESQEYDDHKIIVQDDGEKSLIIDKRIVCKTRLDGNFHINHYQYSEKQARINQEIIIKLYDLDYDSVKTGLLTKKRIITNKSGTTYYEAGSIVNRTNFLTEKRWVRTDYSELSISKRMQEFIEFAADRSKICEFLSWEENHKHITVDNINFLDISQYDPTKISYVRSDKYDSMTDHNPYDFGHQPRVMTKPAKGIRKIFVDPDRFSAQDYETFTHMFKTFKCGLKNRKFRIVEPYDIPRMYDQDYYEDGGRASLGESCMKDKPYSFFDIYADIADGMLILEDEESGLYSGRALLFTTDCGTQIMDRVYHNDEITKELFIQYAIDNGYVYKARQSYNTKDEWINPETNQQFEKYYSISIPNMYDEWPYLDTFTYVDKHNLFITNNGCLGLAEADNTNGELSNDVYGSCVHCGDEIVREEDAYYVDAYGECCSGCTVRTIDGYYELESDCVYVDHHDRWMLTNDTVWSDHEQEHLDKDDAVWSNYENSYLLESKATEVLCSNGDHDWVPNDNAIYSRELNDDIICSEAITTEDGDYIYETNEN